MKQRYKKHHRFKFEENFEKHIARHNRLERKGGFTCSHCRQWVVINELMGTANRNHCNMCLWSKHVDEKKGDRRASCQGGMKPIGLTFRIEGKLRRGEIMLIHDCSGCPKLSINRIAADDTACEILAIFKNSFDLSSGHRSRIKQGTICLAEKTDRQEILAQLFGNVSI